MAVEGLQRACVRRSEGASNGDLHLRFLGGFAFVTVHRDWRARHALQGARQRGEHRFRLPDPADESLTDALLDAHRLQIDAEGRYAL